MNYSEARSMVEAGERAGRLFGIAYYRRTYPAVSRAKQLLEKRVIGRPVFAFATAWSWYSPTPGEESSWRADPEIAGGGPLYDIASHRIDLLNDFFGEPKRVTGQIATLVQSVPVEDNATVLIEHASGVRSVVDVRWHSHITQDEFVVRGTDGEIDLSPLNSGQIRISGCAPESHPPHPNLHFPCVENFVTAVLGNNPGVLRATGRTSLWTDYVTEQIMSSAPISE
jgi:predicted dehydrogenase